MSLAAVRIKVKLVVLQLSTYLHDSLEIKPHSIPKRELPTRRSRKQSPALGCPFHDVDRMLDLVKR